MNKEEFERKMAFIVEQQARFHVGLQQIRALQAETETVVGRLEHATLFGLKDVNARFNSLAASEVRFAEAQIRLIEAQKRTNEKLKKLKKMIDRYFSEGRNN